MDLWISVCVSEGMWGDFNEDKYDWLVNHPRRVECNFCGFTMWNHQFYKLQSPHCPGCGCPDVIRYVKDGGKASA